MSKINKLGEANKYIKKNKENVNREYRLNYHLMGDYGWINDPNGFIQYKGIYNLFYQYNPYKPVHESMHWGHAISTDLIKWKSLPVVLAPDEDYDRSGCFSGSTIEKDNKLYIIYTGHVKNEIGEHTETQCLACSDDGIVFKKYERNPIINIDQIPGCANKNDFRDPKVFKYEEDYYMIIGSNDGNGNGQVLLYKSKNLIDWEYISVIAKGNSNMGSMWECPDVFTLNDRCIFIVSEIYEPPKNNDSNTVHSSIYMMGNLNIEKHVFELENYYPIDYGFDFYAPQTILDDNGRRIMVAWMDAWETDKPTCTYGHNWSGAMTLPRELLLKNNKLYFKPVDEIKNYRRNECTLKEIILQGEKDLGIKGDSYEIELLFENIKAEEFGLKIRASDVEETVLTYDLSCNMFKFNRDKSGIGPKGEKKTYIFLKNNMLKLRILVDKCSVEIFINDGEKVMTGRIYPHKDAINIKAFSTGKSKIKVLKKWDIV